MSPERVLVTGASGLLGEASYRSLRTAGFEVEGGGRTHLDLLAPEASERLGQLAPRTIVHCAAQLPNRFYGEEAEQVARANWQMDQTVIEYARERSVRLIYLSGTSVYGLELADPTDEESPTDPTGPYVAAKLESEGAILEALTGSAILRVSAPYGRRQRYATVLQRFLQQARANEDLVLYGSGSRRQDFIAAADVGQAVVACAQTGATGIFNIAGGKAVSMRELAEQVLALNPGSQSQIRFSGQPDPQENYRACFAIDKARQELGWEPRVSLEAGLREIQTSMSENGEI